MPVVVYSFFTALTPIRAIFQVADALSCLQPKLLRVEKPSDAKGTGTNYVRATRVTSLATRTVASAMD
ncbi:hypothetical protein, partial [Salmonella enterica]|uniref:hypothetical protein n=1 Tax=Salmonella enterica TaxID=28901 RepID=UPI0032991EB2